MKQHKNPNHTEKPGNRPAGIPSNSRFACTGVAFGIMFVVVNFIVIIAGDDAAAHFRLGKIVIFPLTGSVILLMWLLNTGKLIFVKFAL